MGKKIIFLWFNVWACLLIYIKLLAWGLNSLTEVVLGAVAQACVLHVIKNLLLLIVRWRCREQFQREDFCMFSSPYSRWVGWQSFSPVGACSAAGFPWGHLWGIGLWVEVEKNLRKCAGMHMCMCVCMCVHTRILLLMELCPTMCWPSVLLLTYILSPSVHFLKAPNTYLGFPCLSVPSGLVGKGKPMTKPNESVS